MCDEKDKAFEAEIGKLTVDELLSEYKSVLVVARPCGDHHQLVIIGHGGITLAGKLLYAAMNTVAEEAVGTLIEEGIKAGNATLN